MPKVSKDYKNKKKELLLQSALKCFGEKGFQAATMDDIVSYSKTSKGLIYNYFKSKDDLYITLMEERTRNSINHFEEKFKTLETAKGKIHALFEVFLNVSLTKERQEQINVQIEFWLNSGRQENLRKIMLDRYKNQYIKLLVEIIKEGLESGEFHKSIKPEIAAAMFWAYIDGIGLHYGVIGDEYEYKKVFEETEQAYLNYLCK
ncbi:TetR/AcrR family transcriptional regulator [Fictibacillus sp. BK138]|uniref:TetR/AcrR family transcriptional regulator n=1 Tax=Fictibacillus sp. BK138 TaxID=2512121 RepID=UPI0010295BA2|nr:TetR/AcrR family transcriptional regulator [Fictibacillus sp. BK138]RZT15499.1 TetR family transcriptional regulator [Fictibacillus sp. BK138]